MLAKQLTPESVFEGIKKILIEIGLASGSLTNETHLADDLNIDSIDMVDIVLQLEREFGVVLDDRKASSCQTVHDLTFFVLHYSSNTATPDKNISK